MPKGENRMAIKVNQSKQYRIYIKGSKSWVDVNKEFYTNYYRDINAYRKRQQEHYSEGHLPAGTGRTCPQTSGKNQCQWQKTKL